MEQDVSGSSDSEATQSGSGSDSGSGSSAFGSSVSGLEPLDLDEALSLVAKRPRRQHKRLVAKSASQYVDPDFDDDSSNTEAASEDEASYSAWSDEVDEVSGPEAKQAKFIPRSALVDEAGHRKDRLPGRFVPKSNRIHLDDYYRALAAVSGGDYVHPKRQTAIRSSRYAKVLVRNGVEYGSKFL